MIKLNMSHVNAIVHAEFFIDGSLSKIPEPRMRHQLENDLLRLAELKLHVIERMTNIDGLFELKDKPDGHANTP